MESATHKYKQDMLVVFACISGFLYCGTIYGFSAMQLLLQAEDTYSELCTQKELDDGFCPAQQTALNIMFTVGAASYSLTNLPVGMFLDKYGPTMSAILSGFLVIPGQFLLAASDSKTFNAFPYAFFLLGTGAGFLQLVCMKVCFLIETNHGRSVFITTFNCLFDASSAVYPFFYIWYEATDVSRSTIFNMFGILAIVVYAFIIGLWYVNEPKYNEIANSHIREEINITEEDNDDDIELHNIDHEIIEHIQIQSPQQPKHLLRSNSSDESNDNKNDNNKEICAIKEISVSMDVDKKISKNESEEQQQKYLLGAPWAEQLRSYPFMFTLLFGVFTIPRIVFYMGTLEDQLSYSWPQNSALYVVIFSLLNPASTIFVTCIAKLTTSLSFNKGFTLVNTTMTIFSILGLIPSLPLQVVTFCFFSATRGLLFSVWCYFIAEVFGPANMGLIFGVIQIFLFIFNMSMLGFVWMTNYIFNGNFLFVNILFLFGSFILIPLIMKLGVWEKEEKMKRK